MEQFKMPLRQVKKMYKRSEIAIISWRSREQALKMHQRMHSPSPVSPQNNTEQQSAPQTVRGVKDAGAAWKLPDGVNNGVPIPKTFFNTDGNLDLSKAKGKDALHYLNALGLNIPNLAFLADI